MSLNDKVISDQEKAAIITDVIEAIINEYSLKSEPKGDSLEAYLDAYTKDTLLQLAEENAVDVRKSWNKPKMIGAIVENFLGTLEERLLLLGESKLDLILKMTEGAFKDDAILMDEMEFYVSVYPLAVQLGILYANYEDDQVTSFVPVEFVEKIKEVTEDYARFEEKHRDILQEWDRLDKFLTAGVRLYGVMPFERVLELKELYEETLNVSDEEKEAQKEFALKYLPLLVIRKGLYNINGQIIASNAFENVEHVLDTYDDVKEKMADDFYNPDKKEIDYFAKNEFDRSSMQYKRMRQLISNISDSPNYTMDELELSIVMGQPISAFLQMINERKLLTFHNEDEIEEFAQSYQELNNLTHLWAIAGYTPNELAGTNQAVPEQEPIAIQRLPKKSPSTNDSQQPIRVEKIGRNEPCPCGSGKKYKKCHWLKDRQ